MQVNFVARLHDNDSLDDIAQLAHIPWPMIFTQLIDSIQFNPFCRFAIAPGKVNKEMVN